MRWEEVTIGACRLIRGDCEDIVSSLPDVSLLLTDPPYGINMDKGFDGFDGFGGFGKPIARRRYVGDWDHARPSKALFDALLTIANHAIIWGGNFFTDLLPVNGHWCVWDKLNTMPSFSDCELAWTNIPRTSVKKITVQQNGLLSKEKERFHPTQKPVELFHWAIRTYTNPNALCLDPFMGSGTAGIACVQLHRQFIGIEIDPHYFAIACRRIEDAARQLDLFSAPPHPQPAQLALL